jgi:uncharacterized membrane protein
MSSSPSRSPDGVVRSTQLGALACLIALIVLCAGWELWWAPTGRGTLALKALPLLLPLVGLWRHRLYTYRWLSLMVWVYFAEGMVRATSEHGLGQILAAVEAVLSVLLFVACAWQIRWRLRQGKALAAQGDTAEAGPRP